MTQSKEAWQKQRCLSILSERRALYKSSRECDVTPLRILSTKERERCRRINGSFDEARIFLEKSEVQIFQEVFYYDEEKVKTVLGSFLKDVRTCPKEVLQHVEHLLEERRERNLHERKRK